MTSRIGPIGSRPTTPSKHSENKMHDDTVAKRYGFSGGLVPGVDVMAYMMHMPVAKWGRAFLEHGLIEARFVKPVYDGEQADVTARRTTACWRSRSRAAAIFARPAAPRCRRPRRHFRSPTSSRSRRLRERKPVDATSYEVGKWLGAAPRSWAADAAKEYLADIRETDPIYAREGLGHPGLLPRVMNSVLVDNAILGPWIHVGSKDAAAVGRQSRRRD